MIKYTYESSTWTKADELPIVIQRDYPSILLNAFFKKNKIILITERRCIIIEEDPLDNNKLHDNFNESIDFEDLHTSGGIILEKALCCSTSYDF